MLHLFLIGVYSVCKLNFKMANWTVFYQCFRLFLGVYSLCKLSLKILNSSRFYYSFYMCHPLLPVWGFGPRRACDQIPPWQERMRPLGISISQPQLSSLGGRGTYSDPKTTSGALVCHHFDWAPYIIHKNLHMENMSAEIWEISNK